MTNPTEALANPLPFGYVQIHAYDQQDLSEQLEMHVLNRIALSISADLRDFAKPDEQRLRAPTDYVGKPHGHAPGGELVQAKSAYVVSIAHARAGLHLARTAKDRERYERRLTKLQARMKRIERDLDDIRVRVDAPLSDDVFTLWIPGVRAEVTARRGHPRYFRDFLPRSETFQVPELNPNARLHSRMPLALGEVSLLRSLRYSAGDLQRQRDLWPLCRLYSGDRYRLSPTSSREMYACIRKIAASNMLLADEEHTLLVDEV